MLQPNGTCPLSNVAITKSIHVKSDEHGASVIRTYQAEAILSHLESTRLRVDPMNGAVIQAMDTQALEYMRRIDACMSLPVPSRRHTLQYNAAVPSVSSRAEAPTSFRTLADVGGALVRSPSEISLTGAEDRPVNWNELAGSRVSSRQSNGSGGMM